jgi:hypothetical protein
VKGGWPLSLAEDRSIWSAALPSAAQRPHGGSSDVTFLSGTDSIEVRLVPGTRIGEIVSESLLVNGAPVEWNPCESGVVTHHSPPLS